MMPAVNDSLETQVDNEAETNPTPTSQALLTEPTTTKPVKQVTGFSLIQEGVILLFRAVIKMEWLLLIFCVVLACSRPTYLICARIDGWNVNIDTTIGYTSIGVTPLIL